jgi:serine protease AprX
VVSSGNKGSERDATWFAPGNHPLVITVGALDDNQTARFEDDTLAGFSSRGVTQDGHPKPDILAPGRRIVSVLSKHDAKLAKLFPDRVSADERYIRLSGTSMSSPIVAGGVALLLERFPHLTPDQIKGLLVGSARRYTGQVDQAGALDLQEAMLRAARGAFTPANGAQIPSIFVAPAVVSDTLSGPSTTAAYWDAAYWDAAYWDAAYWDAAYWDAAYWDVSRAAD